MGVDAFGRDDGQPLNPREVLTLRTIAAACARCRDGRLNWNTWAEIARRLGINESVGVMETLKKRGLVTARPGEKMFVVEVTMLGHQTLGT